MGDEFIYPNVISAILDICRRHVFGSVSADELQRIIQYGESEIIALEESDIRGFLTDIEGQLELIRFTVDSDKQLQETRAVAQDVILWLNARART